MTPMTQNGAGIEGISARKGQSPRARTERTRAPIAL